MPSIYCGTHFTIFIYCCRSFPSLFLQKSQVPFFLPFSLSLISLSPIAISPFSVPSFHFFILFVFLHFFTSKAVIFYTKTVIFISDSMTTISYLCSSPGLHFYIVILVEEHTKAVIFISKLCECREVSLYCMQRRWKSRLQLLFLSEKSTKKVEEDTKAMIFIYKKLRFLSQTVVVMAGILDRKSADSSDRVADNQEAAKLE
ncbi:hypothetical protein AAZX31_12G112100 [Glycine max]